MERIPPPAPAVSGNQPPRYFSLVLTAVLLVCVAERVEALSWIIPGVANAPGANGAYYVSNLTVVNSEAAERIVTLSLIPDPGTISPPSVKYTILPGKT